ncbi:hypothetical protein EMCRGX_G006240 [Ephydatia muelleri]
MSSLSRELGFLARQSLANALNTTSPLGKDWRGLADKMGFTYEMITVLQTQESPTLSLLEEWERQLGCFLDILLVLCSVGRHRLVGCLVAFLLASVF